MTILTRSTRDPSKRDRLKAYSTRLIDTPDFDHLYHGARIERGRRVQDNIVRLPIPRHRALIVRDPQ